MTAVACDTETAGLFGRVHRVGFMDEAGRVCWLKAEKSWKRETQRRLKGANRLLGHNLRYDRWVLADAGVQLPWKKVDDTIIMANVLGFERKSLLDISLQAIGYDGAEYLQLDDWKKANHIKDDYSLIPDSVLRPYTEAQLMCVHCCADVMSKKLPRAYSIDMRMEDILYRMERRGVQLNRRILKSVNKRLLNEREASLYRLKKMVGADFNPRSPRQVAVILSALGVVLPRTMKGNLVTAHAVLEDIRSPFAEELLNFRGVDKLVGTYTSSLLEKMDVTDVLRGRFSQTITRTGRLSSSNPNLQNIPKRQVKLIREAFVPREGFSVYSADFSQIEFRLAVCISGDTSGIEEMEKGIDFHTATATAILGDADRRQDGKTVNFGILYGMGSAKLARVLGVSRPEADALLDRYFRHYSGIAYCRRKMIGLAERNGELSLSDGRVLRMRPTEVYKAFNYRIQGEAAVVMKQAMLNVDDVLRGTDGAMLMCIHDDLVVELPKGKGEKKLLHEIVGAMKDASQYPMDVEVSKWQRSWADSTPV